MTRRGTSPPRETIMSAYGRCTETLKLPEGGHLLDPPPARSSGSRFLPNSAPPNAGLSFLRERHIVPHRKAKIRLTGVARRTDSNPGGATLFRSKADVPDPT